MATNFSAGTADVEIGPNFDQFVRKLQADLDGVHASLGVEINPDMTNFASNLQAELDLIVATLSVQINPDTAQFAADLQTRLDLIIATLGVKIDPDTASFATDLDTYLSAITATLDVEINPDTTDFANELALRLAIVHQAINIRVGVDQQSLDNLETLIRAKLALMDLTVTVKVDADVGTAANELAALKAAYREMTMNVDADTAAAAAQIAALNGATVGVNVRANQSGGGLLSGLGSESMLLNVGALGLSQLPAAAAAVSSIGIGVQQIAQSGLLLPGIFAAAGAGIATMAVGLDGITTALGDDPKKAAEAYAQMGAEARAVVDTVKSYGDEWGVVQERVSGITLDGVTSSIGTLFDAQIPALDRGMSGLAGKLNEGIKTTLGELGSEKSVAATDTIFGNTTTAAGELNKAIVPIISSVRTLASTGSTFLPQLAKSLTDIATRADAFLTRSDQSGDLARWMREGIEAAGDLLSIIGNLGSAVGSFLRAGKGEGDGFLATTDRLTERWASWMKSAEGQSSIREFLRDGREQMDRWVPVGQAIGSMLKTVYEASTAWSAILLPFLAGAASLLGEHEGILRTVLIAYLAYRTLSPIFTMLQSGWASATAGVARYNAAQAAASGAGATSMRSSLAGLGAMLGPGGVVMIGLAAAAVGIGLLAQKHQDAANAAADQRRKLDELRETLDEQTGAVTRGTISTTTQRLESEGFLTRAQTLGVDTGQYVRAGLGLDSDAKAAINDRLTKIILEQTPTDSYGKMIFKSAASMEGMDATTVAQALQGIPEAVAKFDAGINASRAKGSNPADLRELKEALNDVGESAATLGGEMNGLGSRTNEAGEAQRRINETLSGTWQLTEEGRNQFNELGLAVMSVPNEKTVQVRAATEEQQQKLRDLGYQVEQLPDGTVKIALDDVAAKAQISEIVKPVTKPVTVTYTGEFNKPQTIQDLPAGRADGGPITGGIPGRDSVPIMAMPGEHVLTVDDVSRLGGQSGVYRFRAALAAGRVQPMREGGAVKPWDAGDEIDLQQAQNAITKAQEKLDQLAFDSKATPSERRAAELAVEEARYKAQELEDRKAGRTGTGTGSLILPQAALPGRAKAGDLDRADAEYAVDQANTKRNQVYADPSSTPEARAAADRDYQRAQNSLSEQGKKGGDATDLSLPGFLGKAATILGEGILSGLGLEGSILSGNNVYTKSLGTALDFYGQGQGGQGGDGYAYVPKNLPVDSSSSSSSSSAAGGVTKSAEEYDPAGGVEQWRGTFAAVLSALSMPADWLGLGMSQMQSESGGNPKAINLWDSNAAAGIPSKGLMQVIDPTFAANRSELFPGDIWDPAANIAASLRYTVGRYTTPVGVWGEGHGYRDGGWVLGVGGPRDDANRARLSNREFVVAAEPARTWGPELEAINAGLPRPLAPLPSGLTPRGGDDRRRTVNRNIEFNAPIQMVDHRQFFSELDRQQSIEAQGAMSGLYG